MKKAWQELRWGEKGAMEMDREEEMRGKKIRGRF
jgi:hypothetical protein